MEHNTVTFQRVEVIMFYDNMRNRIVAGQQVTDNCMVSRRFVVWRKQLHTFFQEGSRDSHLLGAQCIWELRNAWRCYYYYSLQFVKSISVIYHVIIVIIIIIIIIVIIISFM